MADPINTNYNVTYAPFPGGGATNGVFPGQANGGVFPGQANQHQGQPVQMPYTPPAGGWDNEHQHTPPPGGWPQQQPYTPPPGGWDHDQHGDGMGGPPPQTPPQIPAEWQTWFDARPQRPEGGFGLGGKDAYRTSLQTWFGTHPALPAGMPDRFGMGMGHNGEFRQNAGNRLFKALLHRF